MTYFLEITKVFFFCKLFTVINSSFKCSINSFSIQKGHYYTESTNTNAYVDGFNMVKCPYTYIIKI